ncbi:sugar porter family MFS transporter [uncultured Megasphaera sp.]|uniref:sugar porter family MFS transporter n=1 Tax=uncultured Megasphaera sp. TaxID=165188 RepID=UPI0025DF1C5C|nr:sugar porter family MFS transporter [uncultured Megasphaera sp.]
MHVGPRSVEPLPLHEGWVVSILLLGAATGSIVGGRLSDMLGRRHNIICLAVLFFFAAIGCSLAPSFEVMLCTRFLLGLAVGGASVTVPTYLAELAPVENRGRMVTQNEFMIVTGQFLAFVCNAIIAIVLAGDPHIWRYMLAVCALPAVFLFFGMLKLPESPRWLFMKGKLSESLAVLSVVRSTKERAIAEFNEIQDLIKAQSIQRQATYRDLMTPWVRRIMLIGIGIAVFTQLTGVNSVMYYGTQILTKAGFSREGALIANTLNGLTSVCAVAFCFYLMTKIKRRTQMLAGFIGTTTALLLITLASHFLSETAFFPFLILGLTVMFLAFMQSCLGPILWLELSEIIPLKLRGLGYGICSFFVWMANFFVGLAFPVMLSSLGLDMTFCVFVIIGLVSITFTKLFVPETKGRSLEEIEAGFRHYDENQSASKDTIKPISL